MKDKIIKLLDDWKVNEHKQELIADELLVLCGVIHWVATKDQTPLNKQQVIIDTGKYGLHICTYPCPLWDDLKPTYWADMKDIKRPCL